MTERETIRVGDRVYLRNAIAGEPGCLVGFDRYGRAEIHWPDMPELGHNTFHAPDTLVLDEGYTAFSSSNLVYACDAIREVLKNRMRYFIVAPKCIR